MLIIERDLMKKPKLGGWKHKKTGVEFLNADSQTGPPPKRVPPEKTCSRKVQTVKQADKECQSTYSQATQMWRKDCYIASVSDKYMDIRPYVSFEELQATDVGISARIIQRCWKAWRLLRFIKECARIYRELLAECQRIEKEKREARRKCNKAYCQAINDPHTVGDMDALLSNLEKTDEFGKIIPTFLHEPIDTKRCRALRDLEERRRAYLQADHSTREAREKRYDKQRARFLTRCCKSKRWTDCKGRIVEMVSLKCQAARECRDLYEQLNQPVGKNENYRMEVLLKARSAVESHDCKPADMFRYLIDQEIIFISKDVEQSKSEFLRKRIVGCVRLHANVRGHVDLKPYERMRADILQSERDFGLSTTIADAISPMDLRHLVLNIWHGRSILSERTNPRELCLPRYEPSKPWSPWNCILLTEEEAETHYCGGVISGGGALYSVHLRRKIYSAHRMARMDFRGLVPFEERIDLEKIDDRQAPVEEEQEQRMAHVGSDNRSEDLIGHLEL